MDEKKESSSIDTYKNNNIDYTSELVLGLDKHIKLLLNKKHIFNIFNWLRNNLTTVILLISGLGSIIQVIELAKINLTYIRFFSATQLISDGALVFTTGFILYITYKIWEYIIAGQNAIFFIEELMYEKSKSRIGIDAYSIVFILSPVWLCILLMNISSDFFIENFFTVLIYISVIYAVAKMSFLYLFYYHKYLKTVPDSFLFKESSLILSKFSMSVIIILAFSFSFSLFFACLYMYRLPDNLDNYKKVDQQIKYDYIGIKSEEYEILYFNDKYIFIEIYKNSLNKKNIAMYETSGLFFDKRIIFLDED